MRITYTEECKVVGWEAGGRKYHQLRRMYEGTTILSITLSGIPKWFFFLIQECSRLSVFTLTLSIVLSSPHDYMLEHLSSVCLVPPFKILSENDSDSAGLCPDSAAAAGSFRRSASAVRSGIDLLTSTKYIVSKNTICS